MRTPFWEMCYSRLSKRLSARQPKISHDDAENRACLQKCAEQEYQVQEYYDDDVRMTRNAEFRRSIVPNIYLEHGLESKIAKTLAKSDGMKNSHPDYTYGLKRHSFAPSHDVVLFFETDLLLEIASYMNQLFLVIEGKCDKDELAEAENQVRQAEVALVNAKRILRERIDEKDITEADTRNFVFDVTVGSKIMEI